MPNPPACQAGSFHLDAPLAQVFPLFTPEGERAWMGRWQPEMLSGREERGSAFRTQGDDGRETTWIVIDYRPTEGRISYARLMREISIGLVDVACSEPADGGTEVNVRYTLTGVSWQGRAFVQEFLGADRYRSMLGEWRSAISAALAAAQRSGDKH
jgi:hypothetical protein